MRQKPGSPREAYQAIIDDLAVAVASHGPATRVAEGIDSEAPADRRYNELLETLTDEQRAVVADMLADCRVSAIHDVLAALSWWVDCEGVGWTFKGDQMPIDQSGQGLHGDFVGRRGGWDWPDGGPSGK